MDGPDAVRMGWPEPTGRAVLVGEPLALLVGDLPAFDVEQFGYLARAIPTVLRRQPDQSQPQRVVISLRRLVVQGASRQADHPACPPLRRCELLACANDGLTELVSGQALGFSLVQAFLEDERVQIKRRDDLPQPSVLRLAANVMAQF